MRRWTKFIVLSLLLGAITSTAVAWSVAVWAPIASLPSGFTTNFEWTRSDGYWSIWEYTNIGGRAASGQFALGSPSALDTRFPPADGTEWWTDELQAMESSPSRLLESAVVVVQYGWPLPAYECTILATYEPSERANSYDFIAAWPWPWPDPLEAYAVVSAVIPFRPIPLGLALDALLFGAIWFGLMSIAEPVAGVVGRRRMLLGAVVAIGLGFLTTIAVAWSSAAWGSNGGVSFGGNVTVVSGLPAAPVVYRKENRTGTRITIHWKEDLEDVIHSRWAQNPAQYLPAWVRLAPPGLNSEESRTMGLYRNVHLDARGWPARAFSSRFESDFFARQHCTAIHGGVRIPPFELPSGNPSNAVRILPLTPIWSGILIDSTLFAVAWWVALVLGITAFRAKKKLRQDRGACPKCGYELHGELAGGCPECGWNRHSYEMSTSNWND